MSSSSNPVDEILNAHPDLLGILFGNNNLTSPTVAQLRDMSSSERQEVIRKQSRRRALLVHPDKCSDPRAAQAFNCLKRATDVLMDDALAGLYLANPRRTAQERYEWMEEMEKFGAGRENGTPSGLVFFLFGLLGFFLISGRYVFELLDGHWDTLLMFQERMAKFVPASSRTKQHAFNKKTTKRTNDPTAATRDSATEDDDKFDPVRDINWTLTLLLRILLAGVIALIVSTVVVAVGLGYFQYRNLPASEILSGACTFQGYQKLEKPCTSAYLRFPTAADDDFSSYIRVSRRNTKGITKKKSSAGHDDVVTNSSSSSRSSSSMFVHALNKSVVRSALTLRWQMRARNPAVSAGVNVVVLKEMSAGGAKAESKPKKQLTQKQRERYSHLEVIFGEDDEFPEQQQQQQQQTRDPTEGFRTIECVPSAAENVAAAGSTSSAGSAKLAQLRWQRLKTEHMVRNAAKLRREMFAR